MPMVTNELIALFNFLFPGFITSFLFYSLTSSPRKPDFDKVVFALVYTIVINALVELMGLLFIFIGSHFALGEWSQLARTLWSIVVAIGLGLLLAYYCNTDKIHTLLRKLRITHQASYPSEWYATFVETKKYVVLHLKDGRRIMGWPLRWPNTSSEGHFVLEDARWLVDKDGKTDMIYLTTVDKIVIDTAGVGLVEFVKEEGDTHHE